ncbi:tripartite tricarboxylate transporter substrate binding protein [Acetobacteraceae bacterium H6797]|nr:tripartite tricarboxylate transporter substrate binding protein [Acetobacteraceae bacterium H6797]
MGERSRGVKPVVTRRVIMAAAGLAALARPALAAWRPAPQTRIIVPAAPGGTTDIMGRMLANHMLGRHGLPVVVENRSGGGGTIGTMEVVRAAPDGATILSGNIGPQAIGYSLFKNLQYTPDSLIPVSNMIIGPNVLVVHPSVPARTVPEFVAWLKANPGKASYGSPGVGQSPHLSGVWFSQLAGVQTVHVPYRGAGPAMVELVAGNIQFMFDNLTTAIQQIRAGKVRAIAVTSAQRNSQLPELPSIRETMPELAAYDVSTWFGMFVPAHTPDAVVEGLNQEIKALVVQPETAQRFAEMGGVPAYGTPAEYKAFVRAEIEKWAVVIKREGLQLDA